MQSPVQGAVHGVNGVHALYLLSCLLGSNQTHRNVNPADDEHTVLLFDFARYFCGEPPIAGINLTRFPCASESAQHSAGGCGNDVVDRGRM